MPPTYLGLTALEWEAIWRSVQVSAVGVFLALPFGVALGWVLAGRHFLGKTVLETIVNVPLVLPPVITGYILLVLFGRHGWIGGRLWHAFGIEIALTLRAAVLAVAVVGFPLLVRSIRTAFHGLDPRLYQAARSLGAGPFDAFFSVSLPLARHGIIAGVVLAFARGLGEFGATLIFYGNPENAPTLSLAFYNVWEGQIGPGGATRLWYLAAAALVLACAALGISEYLERRGRRRESA